MDGQAQQQAQAGGSDGSGRLTGEGAPAAGAAPAPTNEAAGGEEVVTVNVGGERFTTTRATLCLAEGSALAAIFSPRWYGAEGKGLPRDRDGVPFLDYDPECFRLLLAYLRQRRLAGPDVPVPPPAVPRSLSGAWALFVDYLGVADFLAAGALVEGVEELPPPSAIAVAAATAAAQEEEDDDEEEGEMGGMHVPGPLGTTWLGGAAMHHQQEYGGGRPRCSVAPLVFDVVSKGVTAVPDGSAAFMVYSHDVYGVAACSKPLAASPSTLPSHAWRCRVTLSLTAPRSALSLSLGLIAGGLGQAAAAAFPAVGVSSNGADGGCVHGQRSFVPRPDTANSWRDGFRDGDEVILRLNARDRSLDIAVMRAGGAVRCCAYRLALPPPMVPPHRVGVAWGQEGGGRVGGKPASASASASAHHHTHHDNGGAAGVGVGVIGGTDRWFFCCYLSNGVGIDMLPVTQEEMDYALASL